MYKNLQMNLSDRELINIYILTYAVFGENRDDKSVCRCQGITSSPDSHSHVCSYIAIKVNRISPYPQSPSKFKKK